MTGPVSLPCGRFASARPLPYDVGMALMLSKTCDAFKAAGAPDDKAREAAEEIAGFEDRLSNIESDVKLLQWIAGFNVALSMAILALLLRLVA